VAILLLPVPLTGVVQTSRHSLFYPWYALYALPGLVMLLGIGFESLFARAAPPARARATAGAMALFWAAYALSTREILGPMRTLPIQPTREAVALMRPVRDPLDPANDRILTASWWRTPFYYDPRVRQLDDDDSLRALMTEADATGKELYVTWVEWWERGKKVPRIVQLAEDPAHFERVAELYGFEPRGHMLVYRYRGRGDRDRPAGG
jgi:hypothetical protein